MNIKLFPTDRLLMVQFDLNNYQALPFCLPRIEKEDHAASTKRRAANRISAADTRLAEIGRTKISTSYLPISLHAGGYVLVDAQHRERVDQHKKDVLYHAIRYTFIRRTFEELEDKTRLEAFRPFRGVHHAGFQELCELALWGKFRVYRNPFYENHVEIPGQYAISLNFDGRKPLFDGQKAAASFTPETVPDYSLVMVNGALMLDTSMH